MEIDRTGESPLDKCLRIWNYANIEKLFTEYYQESGLMLTSSSLNKILSNRRLNQKEKEILIK